MDSKAKIRTHSGPIGTIYNLPNQSGDTIILINNKMKKYN